ncbi:uncharacterized protein [Pocillopora verrucosa]|uniref:uncharacterized protein isoform X2 n=1 Tax=Pocillopora verrucosa TaxID=203993 RepID=UPI00334204C9
MADCRSNHCREKQRKENFQRKESKHKLVDKAIPNIANAIRTVVDVSENEDFKANCFNLLKVGNENEFKDVMTERLWNIATSRLDVKQHDGRGQIVPHVKVVEDETEEEVKEAKQDQALGTRTTILHLKCWRICSGINEKRKARQAHKGRPGNCGSLSLVTDRVAKVMSLGTCDMSSEIFSHVARNKNSSPD